jgi:hypothetical protein
MGISTSLVRNSMNDQYGPLLESLGGRVVTRSQIEATPLGKIVRAIKRPILQNPQFDQIVREVTLFIVQERITYPQLQSFVEKAQEPNVNLLELAETEAGRHLMQRIQKLWSESESLQGRDIQDFFRALRVMQTQG